MSDFHRSIAIAALALCLTACGGGGTVVSAPPPPAPPLPSPTPTQPPQAAVPFPDAPGTYYRTMNVSYIADVDIERLADERARVTRLTSDPKPVAGGPGSSGQGNFEYRGPNHYAVEFHGFGGPHFRPEDYAGAVAELDIFRGKLSQDDFDNLELAKDSAVALTYTTFGNVTSVWDGSAELTFFAAGSEPSMASKPLTGSASYKGIADGLWIDGTTTLRLYGSAAELTANFDTGRVTSTLALRGHGNPFGDFAAAPATALGTFSGSGVLEYFNGSNTISRFLGSYDSVSGYSGTFTGKFFGPAADEFGLAFELTGPAGQGAFGVAVGKRD